MGIIRDAIYQVLSDIQPATVRQMFYQLVSRGVIAKTENEYKQTVVRLLGEMRRARQIPFDWIADNTRWMRKPATYHSLPDMLQRSIEFYRRELWDDSDVYVEIWLEKDALSGVLFDVTAEWAVPLMVARGYPSISFLNSAAEQIEKRRKPAYLYYFGDFDPSGVDITRAVEHGIREFAPTADITFERVAVTEAQIDELNLPTRPTKTSDSRSRNFEGESVEVDAIAPDTLRRMTRAAIEQHIDPTEFQRLQEIEEQERLTLVSVIENLQEFQGKRLTIRERPNEDDRKRAKLVGVDPQGVADARVLRRDAPDLAHKVLHGRLEMREAMQILEARKRGK
jgi:hypothetical protein